MEGEGRGGKVWKVGGGRGGKDQGKSLEGSRRHIYSR